MAVADQVTPKLPERIEARQLPPGVYSIPKSMVLLQQGEKPVNASVLPVLPTHIVPSDQLPEARPPHVQFAALRDPRLRMVNAIPLDVTVEESTVVVCWQATNEFGTGDTLTAAMDDFAAGLRDLYWQLAVPDANLGSDLQRIKQIVAEFIQPRK